MKGDVWYTLESTDLNFPAKAPFHFITEAEIPASPEDVFDALASSSWTEWFPDFQSVEWLTPPPHGVGSRREVHLKTLAARETFLAFERGKRYSFSIDKVTLPLVDAMMEDIQLESLDQGKKTYLKYHVHYKPKTLMRPIHPLARMIFGRMFKQATQGLKEYMLKQK